MRPLIKNFANDLLSYHGLLIQSPIFSQNFRLFEFGNFQEFYVISKNFTNSGNFTSFSRAAEILQTSYTYRFCLTWNIFTNICFKYLSFLITLPLYLSFSLLTFF